ncbi:hypothetical protein APY94_07315 [Thermococcus celericrescens]|uniref:Uncharacterized protein n=1 Tax=Thermococcus celericrescens TaxID=227598 RepID=A0A117ITQ2_9EURY|nr:hypothetical protein [Thermococcus celericrescens]KUH33070.1 hypothetical protein APY94_07315 [Thermococcus celericrescens]
MTALNEVHVHSAPEGRINRVNKLNKGSNEAPIRRGATKAVKKFRQRFAKQRAVMVKNAGHPYKIKKEGSK